MQWFLELDFNNTVPINKLPFLSVIPLLRTKLLFDRCPDQNFQSSGKRGLSESDNSAKAKNFAIFKFKPSGTPGFECLVDFLDSKINFHFDK